MNKQQIFDVIVGHAKEVLPELESHDFKFEDALKDLGANSIDRSEIVMMTLESIELNIPLIEIAKAENMGQLATLLQEKF
ncbi:acyl carrier protein [Aliikangiella maris]|uniref:Acyl carrier protein n=2 Tax=Aliikangiella maris TaxID=3162458 RepID=A0ABV2BU11_9GAMM